MKTQTLILDLQQSNSGVISLFKGDTFTLNVYVKDNGSIFNLSGYTAILSVKDKASDTTYQLQLYGNEVTYNTATGLITFAFDSDDTASITADCYIYDIEISNGTNTYTLIQDVFEIKSDVTTTTIPSYLITENSQKLIFE